MEEKLLLFINVDSYVATKGGIPLTLSLLTVA